MQAGKTMTSPGRFRSRTGRRFGQMWPPPRGAAAFRESGDAIFGVRIEGHRSFHVYRKLDRLPRLHVGIGAHPRHRIAPGHLGGDDGVGTGGLGHFGGQDYPLDGVRQAVCAVGIGDRLGADAQDDVSCLS